MTITQDIIDEIIGAVGDDKPSLRNCSLVSSSFLLSCRRRLWCKISVHAGSDCKQLHQLFVQNPVLQSFVTSFTITLGDTFYKPCKQEFIAVLQLPFCRLQSFTLDLCLVPASMGASRPRTEGIHVKKLVLSGIERSCRSWRSTAASEGGATTAPHTVVDHCEWNCFEPIDLQPTCLPFMCRLRGLVVNTNICSTNRSHLETLSFIMRSLRISLTAPPTLEHLRFIIAFERHGEFGHTFLDDIRDADFWSDLDSFITHPTGSRLQRVDIEVSHYSQPDPNFYWPYRNKLAESVHDWLPLLLERGILFVKDYSTPKLLLSRYI